MTRPDERSRFVLLAVLGLCWMSLVDQATRDILWFHGLEGVRSASNFGPYDVPLWTMLLQGTALVGMFLVAYGKRVGAWYTLSYAIVVAVTDRMRRDMLLTSDVMAASREAASLILSGKNPYFHFFTSTSPPGSPFPYPPGEPLFYALTDGFLHLGNWSDKFAGIALIFIVAALAPIAGVACAALCIALFPMFHLGAWVTVNGGNDGTLAFLLILSVALLAWSEHAHDRKLPAFAGERCFDASAFFFAWAMFFKSTAWPFGLFILAYLYRKNAVAVRRYLSISLVFWSIVILPFLFPSPSGLISNLLKMFSFHANTWGINGWSALHRIGISVDAFSLWITAFDLLAVAAMTVFLLLRPAQTVGIALLQGFAVLTTGLFLARWSSPDYYAFAGLLVPAAIALSFSQKETKVSA